MFYLSAANLNEKVEMQNFGMSEILIILLIVIILFGGKKIPDLMKGVGEGIRQFKKGLHGDEDNKKEQD